MLKIICKFKPEIPLEFLFYKLNLHKLIFIINQYQKQYNNENFYHY